MLEIKAGNTTAEIESISYQPGAGLVVTATTVKGDRAELEAALVAAVGGGPVVLEQRKAKE